MIVDELKADQFLTFIPRPPQVSESLDIQKMMLTVIKAHNFKMDDFWNMPLNLVFELLGMFEKPTQRPMSRKQVVDGERRFNRLNYV